MTPEQQQSCDKAILCCRRAIRGRNNMLNAMMEAEKELLKLPESKHQNEALFAFQNYDDEGLLVALRNLLRLKKEK